mmetsp:Transcript_19342/g.44082  ORF Transcript_19342/g.44082 Transcript_19342/m.44082 type:complete len:103 (+) Transcript_19342:553-861(+)
MREQPLVPSSPTFCCASPSLFPSEFMKAPTIAQCGCRKGGAEWTYLVRWVGEESREGRIRVEGYNQYSWTEIFLEKVEWVYWDIGRGRGMESFAEEEGNQFI